MQDSNIFFDEWNNILFDLRIGYRAGELRDSTWCTVRNKHDEEERIAWESIRTRFNHSIRRRAPSRTGCAATTTTTSA
jgi:hypothetical protein